MADTEFQNINNDDDLGDNNEFNDDNFRQMSTKNIVQFETARKTMEFKRYEAKLRRMGYTDTQIEKMINDNSDIQIEAMISEHEANEANNKLNNESNNETNNDNNTNNDTNNADDNNEEPQPSEVNQERNNNDNNINDDNEINDDNTNETDKLINNNDTNANNDDDVKAAKRQARNHARMKEIKDDKTNCTTVFSCFGF
mmetsp:Transcript_38568/g.47792  ORF Transcript_38568/g.47792 Transcript_38568/m.47792 type:complete len:199 (-) Transcript_38568:22-618(-)